MEKYSTMTRDIAIIDQIIALLKTLREIRASDEAKKKADALCAEMRKKKASK
jgi:hypothetical protein